MKKHIQYQLLSGVLSLCLAGSQMVIPSLTVYADQPAVICPHHIHDEDCGYSEETPCDHEHDKECYREVTRCIHEHDEDCYSDDYEDEEYDDEASPSDAKRTPSNAEDYLNCPHICDEDSGCITLQLDCAHEHDDECGYGEGTACSFNPEDCEICESKDSGKNIIPSDEENIITAWTFIDEDEKLVDGVLALPGANEKNPAGYEDIISLLPAQITASADEGEIPLTLTWRCPSFPDGGAYSGEYIFTATLPDGYTLDKNAAALCVKVEIGSEEISLYSEGPHSVTVGGKVLSADEGAAVYAVTDDNGTVKQVTDGTVPNNNFVKFEVEGGTGILTLKNVHIEAGNNDGMVLPADSEIVLEGDNTVNAGGNIIKCAGDLEISGEGSLTGEITTESDDYAGIRTNGGSLTVTNSTLDLTINPKYSTAPTITTKKDNSSGGDIELLGSADVTTRTATQGKGWGLCSGAYGSSGAIMIEEGASLTAIGLYQAIYAGKEATVIINGLLDASACTGKCANLLTNGPLTINGTVKMGDGQLIYLAKGTVILGKTANVNQVIIVTAGNYYEGYVFSDMELTEGTVIEDYSKKLDGYQYLYVADGVSLTIPEGKTLTMESLKGKGIDGTVIDNGILALPEGTKMEKVKAMDISGTGKVTVGTKEYSFHSIAYELNGGENNAANPDCYLDMPGWLPNTLAEPSRSGFIFDGWYMDPEYTTKYNSNVSTAIKLYAKWMPVSRYDVIVEGSYAQESGSGNYVEGEIVAIDAGSRSGYQFTGWTVSDGVTLADASKTGTTFTMPAKSVSVMANWKYNGSNSSGGSSSSGSSKGGSGGSSSSSQSGTTTKDPVKGYVNSVSGIVTGSGSGYSSWVSDNTGWWLKYADGSYAKGSITTDAAGKQIEIQHWEFINGKWFAFGASGYIMTSWIYDPEYKNWFYIDVNRGMLTGWQLLNNKWYYFNPVSDGTRGRLFVNTTTPDGYKVGADGAWIQ
ncbi:InlB B-repeat-containing protein [Clostridium sp.]